MFVFVLFSGNNLVQITVFSKSDASTSRNLPLRKRKVQKFTAARALTTRIIYFNSIFSTRRAESQMFEDDDDFDPLFDGDEVIEVANTNKENNRNGIKLTSPTNKGHGGPDLKDDPFAGISAEDDESLLEASLFTAPQPRLKALGVIEPKTQPKFGLPGVTPSPKIPTQPTKRPIAKAPQTLPKPEPVPGPHVPQKRRRKIPGPAGMLHDLSQSTQERKSPSKGPKAKSFSLRAVLDSDAWRTMLRDLDLDESDPDCLINRFNLAWVKTRNCPGIAKRAPVLVCVLAELDAKFDDPRVELRDRSGSLAAMVSKGVMDAHAGSLVPGSILVLREVHVMMSLVDHFVLITNENLVTIYRPTEAGFEVENVCKVTRLDLELAAKLQVAKEKRLCSRRKAQQATESSPEMAGGPGRNMARVSGSAVSGLAANPRMMASTPVRANPGIASPNPGATNDIPSGLFDDEEDEEFLCSLDEASILGGGS